MQLKFTIKVNAPGIISASPKNVVKDEKHDNVLDVCKNIIVKVSHNNVFDIRKNILLRVRNKIVVQELITGITLRIKYKNVVLLG